MGEIASSMSSDAIIPVTKPFLTPQKEVNAMFNEIWSRNWLTNNGPCLRQFETEFLNEFDLRSCILTGNGTLAIQMVLRALGVKGKEVITTPISYIATTSSIVWEGASPVFADILPETMCADPERVKEAITENTAAILLTHCYGIPCDVVAFERIGLEFDIPIIYDAAHAVGSTVQGRSLLDFGDISVTSLHATKMLHAVEGGAIICRNQVLAERLRRMRNFGHKGPESFDGVGINNKMSEFHSAIGSVNLRHFEAILNRRIELANRYDNSLRWERISKLTSPENFTWNCAYYPILFESEALLLSTLEALEAKGIQCRRYFYPALNNLDYVTSPSMPIAEDMSRRVACLPLFHDLSREEQQRVTKALNAAV